MAVYGDSTNRRLIRELAEKVEQMGGGGTVTEEVITTLTPTWINGKYIKTLGSSLGQFEESPSFSCVNIPVEVGEKYIISGYPYYYMGLYALMNGETAIAGHGTASFGNNSQKFEVEIEIPTNVTSMYVNQRNSTDKVTIIKKKEVVTRTVTLDDVYKSNLLYGKKLCVCGDSFTHGDFTAYTGDDYYDAEWGVNKCYPYHIAKRNKMKLVDLSVNGMKLTNAGSGTHFSSEVYGNIPSDTDYLIIAFGLNDSQSTIGTISDNTDSTFYGAFNVAINAIIQANPKLKIGVIINDAWLTADIRTALIACCKSWGLPYLDMRNGENVPVGIGGRLEGTNDLVKGYRDSIFKLSDGHPTLYAHEYRSTFIETFLRTL